MEKEKSQFWDHVLRELEVKKNFKNWQKDPFLQDTEERLGMVGGHSVKIEEFFCHSNFTRNLGKASLIDLQQSESKLISRKIWVAEK